jgi:hypothetical protein
MNATRRNTIQKAITLIEEAKDLLETARSDEQGYFDNMPESFQQGDKGDQAAEVVSQLEEAVACLESAIENASSAVE